MQKIKILDSDTISKIAAGEVIERPANVVKELLENSIDANATKIYIELEDAGLRRITVVDNGCGMSKENAKLAFERFATSKIATIEDLERLQTLGFRGEALPSIAAVSIIELVTKGSEGEVGTYLAVEGGKVKEIKDIGAPLGTTVIVKNIYYNVPARRKFLKSKRIELTHIIDVVTRYALIHYDKTFKLVHNNEELLFSPSSKNMIETITAIYGREYARALIPLNYEIHELRISGYTAKPSLTRATTSHQSIYVNNRYVTSRIVSDAIRDSYFRLVTKDRYPVAIISIKIDPKLIDVNVHPTKNQIKFSDEIKIYDSVVTCIRQTLASEKLVPTPRKEEVKIITEPVYKTPLPAKPTKPLPKLKGQKIIREPSLVTEQKEATVVPKAGLKLPELKVVGQLFDSFIIAEAKDSILVIDQHAADERIILEQIEEKNIMSRETQELLEPLVLELPPKEEQILQNYLKAFEEFGFKIENFGSRTYKLRVMPVILGKLRMKEDFIDVIDDLASAGKLNYNEAKRKLIEILACKSAIKANEKLSIEKMEKLIFQLGSLEKPFTCAHGRPTILELSRRELERMFKRT